MEFPVELPGKFAQLAEDLGIRAQDISETFTRGTGPGGQKINKTSICVELTHIPTGTVVRVQKHRQQSANRLSAYKLLISKVEEKKKGKESAKAKRIFKLRKQKVRRSKRAKEKILEAKHHRSDIKDTRKKIV
ncbi:peptide chain release factor-like protein [Candidatus Peregrinibacteria bacterium CG10_big_fil_rev_8_21_14_0_10_49_24]|nr:MAG: peptide chain release factor-like protein [Candidatus Peregrinibacteria bacterium CG11_big_fil_rev_8_21_14_0_20_49_14]PIR50797.1 MAG: peptide chain release factor-like protein [Candidatus Peregrinibacteria bacterium CG10_big_fil_rev_8_21_14_0_10_49_24]PJA67797.1 MAG: peptide chain release factor-like protein [Candidatus Peregrinibacteria bacterium CG_4_9_14_3_um_filter_49_12]